MKRALVVNRKNNMGDCMCQMRGLKEWKEKNPEYQLDFVTSEYLHAIVALHTDLFKSVRMESPSAIREFLLMDHGYDKVIEFEIEWNNAVKNGILRAWTEETLGFTPSTDKPYFIVRPEEELIAINHAKMLDGEFRKLCLMQLQAPSGYVRSYKYEDWEKVIDLFPEDVGIVYPAPLDMVFNGKLKPRKNLILLPGYSIGVNAALFKFMDFSFLTHGGMAMLAHAVDAKDVIHTIFTEAGSPNILNVPYWDNLVYKTHNDIDWEQVEKSIQKMYAKA